MKLLISYAAFTICFCGIQVYGGEEKTAIFKKSSKISMQKKLNQDQMTARSSRSRYGRFLSLFTVVQFEREECQSTSGDMGTCLSVMECSQRGGTSDGSCAAGFGTCCIFLKSCGSSSRENRTLFVNNGYPSSYDGIGTCQIKLMKVTSNICQYRLDFDQFILMGPENRNHICDNDQFIVTGALGSFPIICGMNTGNHIYVDAGMELQSSLVLSVVTNGPTFQRTWKIGITQIPCAANYKADEGCLQYFYGVNGQIKSFNFNLTSGLQLSNQDYGICIRQERNFCGVQYTQCPDPVNTRIQSFTLSGNSNGNVPAMVGSTGSSNFCQSDYLIIPMVSNVGRPATGPSASVDRVCGGILSADVNLTPTTIKSSVKPFRLWFHTDGMEASADVANKGFCLNYVQQPCTNSF